MHRNPQSLIRQRLNFQCPICSLDYNQQDRFPMIICHNQHSVCLNCTKQYIFKSSNISQCSICRQEIHQNHIIRFRFLNQIKRTADQLRQQGSIIRKGGENVQQCWKLLSQEKDKNTWLIKQCQLKQNQIQQLKKRIKSLQKSFKQDKKSESQSQSHQGPKINAQEWVQQTNPYYKHLVFKLNTIKQDNKYDGVLVFGKYALNKVKNSFTVHIDKFDQFMKIGIVDQQYKQKQGLKRQECPNWIYCKANGFTMNKQQKTKSGKGYKQGDTVTVKVNFTKGYVHWVVNQAQTMAVVQNDLLMSGKIQWVPYIWIYKLTKVSIIQ